MASSKKAVVLISGGLDSATCAAVAKMEGYAIYGLTVDYGQRHIIELEAAKRVAKAFDVKRHEILSVDLRAFGKSALTDQIDVPKDKERNFNKEAIPVTYVPARNTILLSLALAFAETVGAYAIYAGMNAVDYSGYPDCRPAFIEAFERMANLGTKAAVCGKGRFEIRTPLIDLSKSAIIKLGAGLGVDYSVTHSCYDPDSAGKACGLCESCILRRIGFEEAGIEDPTIYKKLPF